MIENIIKIFFPSTISFFVGIGITPFVTHYLYKYKMWKKQAGKKAIDGSPAVIFNALHKDKEVGIPRMGGIVIWVSVLVTTLFFWLLSVVFPSAETTKLNFLSNNQTLLPLATLIVASVIGLVDDWLVIGGAGGTHTSGLSLSRRIFLILAIGMAGAYWFYVKLETSAILVPFWGEFELGIVFIPFFMLVMLALFSGGGD